TRLKVPPPDAKGSIRQYGSRIRLHNRGARAGFGPDAGLVVVVVALQTPRGRGTARPLHRPRLGADPGVLGVCRLPVHVDEHAKTRAVDAVLAGRLREPLDRGQRHHGDTTHVAASTMAAALIKLACVAVFPSSS